MSEVCAKNSLSNISDAVVVPQVLAHHHAAIQHRGGVGPHVLEISNKKLAIEDQSRSLFYLIESKSSGLSENCLKVETIAE